LGSLLFLVLATLLTGPLALAVLVLLLLTLALGIAILLPLLPRLVLADPVGSGRDSDSADSDCP